MVGSSRDRAGWGGADVWGRSVLGVWISDVVETTMNSALPGNAVVAIALSVHYKSYLCTAYNVRVNFVDIFRHAPVGMFVRWFLPASLRSVATVNGVAIAGVSIGGALGCRDQVPPPVIAHRKAAARERWQVPSGYVD